MNTEFKRKHRTCGRYGHKQNRCPMKNKGEKKKEKFTGKCNYCGKMGQKATNCWKTRLIKTKDQRIGRRKKKRK